MHYSESVTYVVAAARTDTVNPSNVDNILHNQNSVRGSLQSDWLLELTVLLPETHLYHQQFRASSCEPQAHEP